MKAPLAVAATICALPSLMAAWMVLYGLAWPPHPVVQVLVAFTYKVTVPTARTSRVTPASARTEARTTNDVRRDRRSRERAVSFALSNLSPSGRSARQRQLRLTEFVADGSTAECTIVKDYWLSGVGGVAGKHNRPT